MDQYFNITKCTTINLFLVPEVITVVIHWVACGSNLTAPSPSSTDDLATDQVNGPFDEFPTEVASQCNGFPSPGDYPVD